MSEHTPQTMTKTAILPGIIVPLDQENEPLTVGNVVSSAHALVSNQLGHKNWRLSHEPYCITLPLTYFSCNFLKSDKQRNFWFQKHSFKATKIKRYSHNITHVNTIPIPFHFKFQNSNNCDSLQTANFQRNATFT